MIFITDVPTVVYLIFRSIDNVTIIGASNLKDDIEKATILWFGKNLRNILDYMLANNTIIINKGGHHKYYVNHIFRDILAVPKSTFDFSIEISKG